jgi:carboxymethylenebutenolidase
MIERQLDIATKDGASTTFVTHPEREGPHPVIVFLMDAPAIREELRDMARRFAAVGYYVMLPNLYYREKVMELGPIDMDPNSASRKQMYDLMNSLSIRMVLDDVDGMIAFAEADPAADASRVGAVGYCMSGRFALCAGAHRPERVKATASVYGVKLVTDQANSPHLAAKGAPAEFYIACAETDHWAPMSMVEQMQTELAGANGEVELYMGVEHGFAFPKRHCFDKPAAERHWERLYSLFRRNLG